MKVHYAKGRINIFVACKDTIAVCGKKNGQINFTKDWKALSHAVRVAREAEELLSTYYITFPRPEKDLLLKIKKGEMQYQEVSEIIEEGLVKVENAKEKSTLPEKSDIAFVEELVYNLHMKSILKW